MTFHTQNRLRRSILSVILHGMQLHNIKVTLQVTLKMLQLCFYDQHPIVKARIVWE